MKTTLLTLLTALAVCFPARPGFAAEAPTNTTNSLIAGFQEVAARIQTKLRAGQRTEAELAPELKALDDLLAAHKSEKTEEAAQLHLVKAMLYLQLKNSAKAIETVRQVKADFPETGPGRRADEILASIEKQIEAEKIQAALVPGAPFPDFNVTDLQGQPLSLDRFKGKVLLIDFWATWCGPCIIELPNVLETYEKHHANGFEIVGISLDTDRAKLESFIAQRKMTWPQFFDGKYWTNQLAVKYGVDSIPATYLLDGEGKILAKDLRGEQLEAAVAKALKK